MVESPTLLYLVMEHAPAGSLLDYVRSRKRLAESDAIHVLQQIVVGLEYCHRREVVHRWGGRRGRHNTECCAQSAVCCIEVPTVAIKECIGGRVQRLPMDGGPYKREHYLTCLAP